MKKRTLKNFWLVLLGILCCGTSFAQSGMSNELYDLAKIKSGMKNHRISSYDRSGNNRDHLNGIKPGDTRIIAEIEGVV